MENRNSRKSNFIILNAPESESNLKENVKKIIQLDAQITAHQVLRLGNKGGKNGPIFVIINDLDAKRKLFKEFYSNITNGNDDEIKKIKLAHDLAQLQRGGD